MTVFIGDVHSKWDRYKKIISRHANTIQVGDFGIGFRKNLGLGEDDPYYPNAPYDKMLKGGHRFIRGNHDNPNVCRNHTQWIADGTIEENKMFIGGALSIDRHCRIEGYSYWKDEELTYDQLDKCYLEYCENKPEIMVTHDCPEMLVYHMRHRIYKCEWPSITRQAFQRMWEEHKPRVWVYGHWHISFDKEIEGTRFICLNELEYKDIV